MPRLTLSTLRRNTYVNKEEDRSTNQSEQGKKSANEFRQTDQFQHRAHSAHFSTAHIHLLNLLNRLTLLKAVFDGVEHQKHGVQDGVEHQKHKVEHLTNSG